MSTKPAAGQKMELLAAALKKSPKLDNVTQDALEAKQSLTKHLTKDGPATINGIEVPQEIGQRITRNSRNNSVDIRLDGIYKINRVDATSPDGFRVRLQEIEGDLEFDAGVQDALLSLEQMNVLRDAEWKKVPVDARINAKRKGKEIFDAVVVDVKEYSHPSSKKSGVSAAKRAD